MEQQIVYWIVGGLGSALTIVAVWAWNHTHKRIDDVCSEVDEKADKVEMDKQRGHTEKIFENLKLIEVSAARIQEQMSRVTSDMESEKRTRADANRAIMNELRRVSDTIANRSHRATDGAAG